MNALPSELLVRVLMQMEPEELSRCDQLSKLFHGPPSLVEQALRLLSSEGGRNGMPETLPNNHANWTQALLFLAILWRGSKYKLVACSNGCSAFVDADGTLLMCGKPYPGTEGLGFGGTINQSIPTPVAGLVGVRVQSVVAKRYHIIALSVDGVAFSWGCGAHGQLGHGDREHVAQPKAIRALSNVCAIETETHYSLAITSDGALWSWGSSEYYQLGHGDDRSELLPRRLEALAGKRMCAAAAGYTHSLAACVDGGCFLWGTVATNYSNRMYSNRISQPQSIHALCGEHVSSVAASDYSSCVVTRQGDIWLWGSWGRGSGLGCMNEPTPLKGTLLDTHRVVFVSYHNNGWLALTADGTVFSWVVAEAYDSENVDRPRHLLGHGDAVDAPCTRLYMPRPIEALAGQHVCSVLTTNNACFAAGWTDGHAQRPQWACWSWGYNSFAEHWQSLGHGEKHANTSLPRRVVGMGVATSVTG